MATMVNAMMMCAVQEDVDAAKASEDKPVNCVSQATTAPTAQVDQKQEIHGFDFNAKLKHCV